jgi:hypothetical protein
MACCAVYRALGPETNGAVRGNPEEDFVKRSHDTPRAAVVTIGVMLATEPEDECTKRLEAVAATVRDLSPAAVTTRFEVLGTERVDPVRCAGTVRFITESRGDSVPVESWVRETFERQLGRVERVLYSFDRGSLRLGTMTLE